MHLLRSLRSHSNTLRPTLPGFFVFTGRLFEGSVYSKEAFVVNFVASTVSLLLNSNL